MALGPLFRAAAALGTESSAGSHSSLTHMRSLLYWLWKDATAAAFEEEGPKVCYYLPIAYKVCRGSLCWGAHRHLFTESAHIQDLRHAHQLRYVSRSCTWAFSM